MEDMGKIVTEVPRKAVKEFLENLMNTERDLFLIENQGQKNEYYSRSMKTKMGEIRDHNVPKNRNGSFQTAVFEPYSRLKGIDELILALYSKGISTKNSAEIMHTIFQSRYSRSTIFLDGLFFFLRRDTVEKEPLLFIADGVPRLDEEIKKIFPRAEFQFCDGAGHSLNYFPFSVSFRILSLSSSLIPS